MTRFLKLAVVILSVISLASAQYVETLNTPIGPVSQDANVPVTWTLIAGADATGKTGELSVTDSASKSFTVIDPAVPLAPKSYTWQVKVPPGTYYLGLNDGSGPKQSGEVVVKAPTGGDPAPAPAPAPAPPAGGPAAPAPPPPAAQVSSDAPAPGTSSSPGTSTPTGSAGSTGSASSIFSGYEVVFSLFGVAIAMVQF